MRCLVIRGDEDVLRFEVPGSEVRIGSDPSNDLVVPMRGVSRFHARLVPDASALRLFDLDSKNGLLVRGKRCREVTLLPGVVVQAGEACISLDDGSTSDIKLAVAFPAGAVMYVPGEPGTATETASPALETRDAFRLVQDLERLGEKGRRGPDVPEILVRTGRVLAARTVALLRAGSSGWEVALASGDPPGAELLAALPTGRSTRPSLELFEAQGVPVAWVRPSSRGGLGGLALLPAGGHLASWQRDLLEFCLRSLTDASKEVAREVAASVQRTPRLVYPDGMVPGTSPAMRALLGQIAKTVHSRIDVLVLGETGTGKELIARLIHASGPTPDGPLVALNCAAIPLELLESELFGVRARVATGVDAQAGRILEAHGGTLLLDEIGEMPLALQPKILRFLQEREVQSLGASKAEKVAVRVIAVSNRDLASDVRAGRFRADLYYRLRGLEFQVPPLRQRKADLAALVAAFAARAAGEEGKVLRGLSQKALDLLLAYDWPGNVRELRSAVNRAVLFCPRGGLLTSEHFDAVGALADRVDPAVPRSNEPGTAPAPQPLKGAEEDLNLRSRLDGVEQDLIRSALERTAGNKSRAAELLGITRAGLKMKLARLLPKRGPGG